MVPVLSEVAATTANAPPRAGAQPSAVLLVTTGTLGAVIAFRHPPGAALPADDDVLAAFLAPKPALWAEPLDVALGATRFVGGPTAIDSDGARCLCNVVFVLEFAASARARLAAGEVAGALGRAVAVAAGRHGSGFVDKALKGSLAQTFITALEVLQGAPPAHVTIGEDVRVWLPPPQAPALTAGRSPGVGPLAGLVGPPVDRAAEDELQLRPFHALVPRYHAVQGLLPADAAWEVVAVAHLASPLRSLGEVCRETGLPLRRVLRAAAHLVLWGVADVVHAVTPSSVYLPRADVHPRQTLDPVLGVNVTSMLGTVPQPIAAHLSRLPRGADKQARFLNEVARLVTDDLVVELACFPFLRPQPTPGPGPGAGASVAAGPASAPAPDSVTGPESALRVAAPHLDGRLRLEEVLWRCPDVNPADLIAALTQGAPSDILAAIRPVACRSLRPSRHGNL